MDDLKNNATDIRASLYKGITGAIPIAGPIISEIISSIIPNQRIDRISVFLGQLNERVSQNEQETLKINKYFIDLLEDGIIQASRALSDRRNKYIAIFLSKSKNITEENYTAKKKLFHILEELTDRDIDVLLGIKENGYWKTSMEHTSPSISIGTYNSMSEDEKYENDLQSSLLDSNITTLERHNLISPIHEKEDHDYGSDNNHIDDETGMPIITDYTHTVLGKTLLNSIFE